MDCGRLTAGLAGVPVTAKPITIGTVKAKEVDLGQISIYYGADGGNLIVSDQQVSGNDTSFAAFLEIK